MFFTLTATLNSGIDLPTIVLAAAREAGLSHSDLWMGQGYAQGAQWDRVLAGRAPLDLGRLCLLHTSRAHIRFWTALFGKLSSALIVRSFGQAVQDIHAIRGNIAHAETKRRQLWS